MAVWNGKLADRARPSSRCTERFSRVIFLRFLDSPGDAWPEPIKAAFFVQTHATDRMAGQHGKNLVKRAHAAGHIIGVHSGAQRDREDHVYQQAAGTLTAHLQRAKIALKALGLPAPEFVRGPAGLRSAAVDLIYTAENLDYVFWDIDAFDLTRKGTDDPWIENWLTEQLRQQVKSIRGTDHHRALVVRLHDTSFFTAAWLPQFIKALADGAAPLKPGGPAIDVRFCRTRAEVAALLHGSSAIRGDANLLKPYEVIHGNDQGDEPVLLHWILRAFEGSVEHLYLDSKGKVTVGIGHHIEKVADIDGIALIKPDGTAADVATKRGEWEAISKLKYGEKIAAGTFRNAGPHKLRITSEEVTKLLCEDDRQTRGSVVAAKVFDDVFPKADAYKNAPLPARLAIVDMAFNLGGPKLKSEFVQVDRQFGRHVKARRWSGKAEGKGAAEEARRKQPVKPGRNQFAERLLEASQILDHSPVILAALEPPIGTITSAPAHAKIPLHLKLEPGWTLVPPFDVTPTIEWRDRGRADTVTLPMQTVNTAAFDLVIPTTIIQGGIIRVAVSKLSVKNGTVTHSVPAFSQLGRIRADNPTKSAVKAALGALTKPPIQDASGAIDLAIAYQSIAYHATTRAPGATSADAYKLFDVAGAPVFQSDAFFGLLRLASAKVGPRDGSVYWDWKRQIRAAEARLIAIEAAATRATAAARAKAGGAIALTPRERLLECLQRWGADRDDAAPMLNWKWNAAAKKWVPLATRATYADEVAKIYDDVQSGNPPPNF